MVVVVVVGLKPDFKEKNNNVTRVPAVGNQYPAFPTPNNSQLASPPNSHVVPLNTQNRYDAEPMAGTQHVSMLTVFGRLLKEKIDAQLPTHPPNK